ncbi:MAG TPA: hypothetical protein PLS03_09685, partial [Terrimicrobiaceae bacterium]|nr:hypothetical protein [Terrimicrobiaceae bacterium]
MVSSLFPLLGEAQSPTYAVTDAASWATAISQANANPGENAVINIQANLALGGQEFLNANVTILGGGHTIDMQNYDRALFIAGGAVTIQDLRITNGFGAGGIGSNGGGGAGLGGAIFIGSGTYASGDGSPAVLGVSAPNVTLIDVSFSDNAVYGGAGFATTPEGGGGGGMRGSGAWGINSYGLAGGGGGGIGVTAAGGNATENNGGAGAFLLNPGGNPGGDGGNGNGTDGGSGGVNAGGGGGGGYGDSEGEVAGSGGGGGVNGERGYYQNGDAPTGGGDGGFGGGGGGSSY